MDMRKPLLACLAAALVSVHPAAVPGSVSARAAGSGSSVGLLCTWVAFESVTESFIVNLSERALYWVNQNQMMNVRQFNAGRIVAEGIRDRLKVGPVEFREKVPVRAVFDRVSGEFHMLQDAHPPQGSGSCHKRSAF